MQGIVVFFVIIIIVAGVGAFWFWHQGQATKNAGSSSTPTPLLTPTSSSTPTSSNGASLVGLNVGDTFTYKLRGEYLGNSSTTILSLFSIYNNTDYYQVTITGISGTKVSLNTLWRLTNGTQTASSQTIDLSNGQLSDANGFYPIYPSNLNVNDFLYPHGNDRLIVNSTTTQNYTTSYRETNVWSTSKLTTVPEDPTGMTQEYTNMTVSFDKQTGMLTSLTNIQESNNPEYETIITWELYSTNVWTV
ncbi:MAG: hypothetical protein ABSF65_07925 [Candidatus Bathyarchaeia archaeon]